MPQRPVGPEKELFHKLSEYVRNLMNMMKSFFSIRIFERGVQRTSAYCLYVSHQVARFVTQRN